LATKAIRGTSSKPETRVQAHGFRASGRTYPSSARQIHPTVITYMEQKLNSFCFLITRQV